MSTMVPVGPTSGSDRLRRHLSFPEIRLRLRRRSAIAMAFAVALVFAFVSMLAGGMIILESIGGAPLVQLIPSAADGQWWNYPELIVVLPWGFAALAFLPTISMILVSAGVGVGCAVGFQLLAPIMRREAAGGSAGAAAGATAGLGPAVAGLATLGACCCTGCLGAVGLAVVAAASGVSLSALLLHNWYIGLFQVAVVFVSLLATEGVLRRTKERCASVPPIDRPFVFGVLLRGALLVAGITWSLAMLIEWGDTSPLSAPPALWYHWTFEHQLLALTAIAAGLFPEQFVTFFRDRRNHPAAMVLRVGLGVAALTWGFWVPAPLTTLGLGGFLNEVFGFTGAPVAWGSVPPDAPLGLALGFHWAMQHLLLAGFALAVAIVPATATAPLEWTISAARLSERPSEGPARAGPAPEAWVATEAAISAEATPRMAVRPESDLGVLNEGTS